MSWASTGVEEVSGSALQGVLLALLLGEQEPLHGYKLTTLVTRRLGPAWGVTRQSVYKALKALEQEKLVCSTLKATPVRGGRGRGRKVYFAAGGAEQARAAWMESPLSRQPWRVELHARMAVSRIEDAPQLLQKLDAYERDCFAMLRESGEAGVPMGSWAGLALNLRRMAVDAGLQAELEWIATARRWIREFLAEAESEPG
jgi:DNA-binding PadR family transcriptional regulator